MQTLQRDFAFIDIREFQGLLEQKGFQLVEQDYRTLPGRKTLWFGVFARGLGVH
jgi:hypothetical protein